MPIQVKQLSPDQHPSGCFALVVTGSFAAAVTDASTCQVAFLKVGTSEYFLHPTDADNPWKPAAHFEWPRSSRREGNALWLEFDPGVTCHLEGNTTYRVKLRSEGGPEASDGFQVPASLRRQSTRPAGWVPPPDPKAAARSVATAAPGPIPDTAPAPATVSATPEAAPATWAPPIKPVSEPPSPAAAQALPESAPPASGAPSRKKWLIPAALGGLAILGALGAFLVLGADPGSGSSTLTMDTCRQTIVAAPDAVKAREQAEALAKDRKLLDCQLLLFKYAAEKGDSVAARRLGGFYDPDTWSRETSPLPAPNPLEAARWHKAAADAGDAESLFRYGMLLKLGRTDEPDGPEKATAYLQKALAAGHPLAKTALGQ